MAGQPFMATEATAPAQAKTCTAPNFTMRAYAMPKSVLQRTHAD